MSHDRLFRGSDRTGSSSETYIIKGENMKEKDDVVPRADGPRRDRRASGGEVSSM
jgi:hypothetical protein